MANEIKSIGDEAFQLYENMDGGPTSVPDSIDPSIFSSPIERFFIEAIPKYLNVSVDLDAQVPVLGTSYLVDFVLCSKHRAIGIECDGKEFHNYERDQIRDKRILNSGNVDAIYRMSGRDLYFHIHECLGILSRLEPTFFSERGIVSLRKLARPELWLDEEDSEYQAGCKIQPEYVRLWWPETFEYEGHVEDVIRQVEVTYRKKIA